ncbi:hypothetical protein ACH4MA_34355 [Streptomyces roseolus]|uniref:hypothetical protein n=1 Tax=Streptomyces roseolus TaxID=67358 RepID=UPI0037A4AEF4
MTARLRARGRYARERLLLSWRPDGRTVVREGPEQLLRMVETAALAHALELVERAAEVPAGLDGEAGAGWQAAGDTIVAALRRAVEYQAGRLPPRLPPRRRPARQPDREERTDRPAGRIDWSQG